MQAFNTEVPDGSRVLMRASLNRLFLLGVSERNSLSGGKGLQFRDSNFNNSNHNNKPNSRQVVPLRVEEEGEEKKKDLL